MSGHAMPPVGASGLPSEHEDTCHHAWASWSPTMCPPSAPAARTRCVLERFLFLWQSATTIAGSPHMMKQTQTYYDETSLLWWNIQIRNKSECLCDELPVVLHHLFVDLEFLSTRRPHLHKWQSKVCLELHEDQSWRICHNSSGSKLYPSCMASCCCHV